MIVLINGKEIEFQLWEVMVMVDNYYGEDHGWLTTQQIEIAVKYEATIEN